MSATPLTDARKMVKRYWDMKPRIYVDRLNLHEPKWRWVAEVKVGNTTYQACGATPYEAWYIHKFGLLGYRTYSS